MANDREPLSPFEIERLATRFFGSQPTSRTRRELRFGRNGKIAVELEGKNAGCWYDFSEDRGGRFQADGSDNARDWRFRVPGRKSQTWMYRDRDGNLAGVARFDLSDGRKSYRPFRLNGAGEVAGMGDPEAGFRLYNEDRLDAYPDALVIVTEGEKAADAAHMGPLAGELLARDRRVVGLTWPHGAGSAHKADWSPLRGRHVVLIPDNDTPGRKAMEEVAELLMEAGAASVRILRLPPDLPDGWDVADPLPIDRLTWAMFAEMVLEAPELVSLQPRQDREITTRSFTQLRTETVVEEPDYIEPDLLGPGGLLLIAGPPKAQKSFLLMELLVACATGTDFLDGLFRAPRPLRVFYLQAEMNAKLLRRRVREFRGLSDDQLALLDRNLIISNRFHMMLNEDGLKTAVETIRQAFPNEPPDIIAIDPLANVFDGDNENDNAQLMRFISARLEVLRQLINPLAAAILAHHAVKRAIEELQKDPFSAIRGAGALRGYYDSALVIFRKSQEGKAREIHFELRSGESPEPVTKELIAGRFVDGQSEDVTRSIAVEILIALDAAWNEGRPLSLAPQSRMEGRYAPRVLHSRFGISAKAAQTLIEDWLQNDVVRVEMVDRKTKVKGLKRLVWL